MTVRGAPTQTHCLAADRWEAMTFFSQPNGKFVVVTINYRLGVFGFIAGNEIKANGALNAGLRK
jgi:carboxylesterase type B